MTSRGKSSSRTPLGGRGGGSKLDQRNIGTRHLIVLMTEISPVTVAAAAAAAGGYCVDKIILVQQLIPSRS